MQGTRSRSRRLTSCSSGDCRLSGRTRTSRYSATSSTTTPGEARSPGYALTPDRHPRSRKQISYRPYSSWLTCRKATWGDVAVSIRSRTASTSPSLRSSVRAPRPLPPVDTVDAGRHLREHRSAGHDMKTASEEATILQRWQRNSEGPRFRSLASGHHPGTKWAGTGRHGRPRLGTAR
jgi:hypothetical protein